MEYKIKSKSLKQSGLYVITNSETGKKYVGRAVCLRQRYNRHLNDLLKSKHSNKHLQRSFDKCGKDKFVFDIIEFCDKDILEQKEQVLLNEIQKNKEQYYNISFTASGPGNCLDETGRQKISDTLKGKKHSKDRVAKIVTASRNRQTKALLLSPDGQKIEVIGIKEFSEKNSLSRWYLSRLIHGKISQYRGWKLIKILYNGY